MRILIRVAVVTLACCGIGAMPQSARAQCGMHPLAGAGDIASNGCDHSSPASARSRANPALKAFRAIQQNLQNENQAVSAAEDAIINAIQQNQAGNQGTGDTGGADSSAFSNPAAMDSGAPGADVASGPDPAELRQEAAADLLSEANSVLDGSSVPAVSAALPDAAGQDSDIATSVSNVLGDDNANSSVAADVSNVLGNSDTGPSVATDVSTVLEGDSAFASSPSTASSPVALFAAAESYVPSGEQSAADPAQNETVVEEQIQDADTEVLETNSSDAQSADEVTQEVENAMPAEEASPSLGSWLEQNLSYVQTGLNDLLQKNRDALADSTSNDPVEQKTNEIYAAANPLTGLGPSIAAAGGDVPAGLYNYLNTLVGKTGQLFGLIVTPDGDQ